MLSDISNINNNTDLLYIFTGVIIIDLIVIFIARQSDFFGKQINIWYDRFGLNAVILDVFIIVIGFIITRYIFYYFDLSFTPLKFISILVIVQLIHDLLFYYFSILPTPYSKNDLMDIYKDYSVENSYKILIADASMMIGSALIAMNLKNYDMHVSTSLLILSIYILPYLLYLKK